jgi:uncharacterized protein (DUF849 family)
MSPYLPVTPDEIIANALGAAEAGAEVLPLDAHESRNGRPDRPAEFSSLTRGPAARQQSSTEQKP